MSRMSRLLRPFVVTLLVFAMQPAFAHPAPDGFADLAARLLPGVVNIASTQTIKGGGEPDMPDLPFPAVSRESRGRGANRKASAPASSSMRPAIS